MWLLIVWKGLVVVVDSDVLLTRREVAALLRVSPTTLSRWAGSGEGPPVVWLSSGVPRYWRGEVMGWLERQGA